MGTSYAFTKLGLDGFDPLSFVLVRLLIGASVLTLWMKGRGQPFPREPVLLRRLAGLGAVNVIGAFVLITWGQQYVASSYAALLVASGPIFTSVGAALLLPDERVDARRVVAVALGFAGVVALLSGDLGAGAGGGHSVARQLAGAAAIVGGACIVASVGIGVRLRVSGLSAAQIALPQVLAGTVTAALLTAVAQLAGATSFRAEPWSLGVIAAVLSLGILNAGLGNIVYFHLILHWGVTRTALVGYVAPFLGAAIGAGLLHEVLGPNLVVGLLLTTASLVAVNARRRDLAASAPRPEATPRPKEAPCTSPP
jgi:drug/metabolite transporter (DMT)-like permease